MVVSIVVVLGVFESSSCSTRSPEPSCGTAPVVGAPSVVVEAANSTSVWVVLIAPFVVLAISVAVVGASSSVVITVDNGAVVVGSAKVVVAAEAVVVVTLVRGLCDVGLHVRVAAMYWHRILPSHPLRV